MVGSDMLEQELLAATLGIDATLYGKVPKFTQSRLASARNIEKQFIALAAEFADRSRPGPMPEVTVSRKRFIEIVDALNNDQGDPDLSTYPQPLDTMLAVQLADNRVYLQTQLPTMVPYGTFSLNLVEPSDSDKARFMWQANLIDDPVRFGYLFCAGALTTVETALMRTLFPALFDVLLLAVMDEAEQAILDNKIQNWEGGWKRLAMSNLLGVQVDTFQNVLAWQTGFEEKTAGRPPNPGRIELAEANATDLQKTQAR